MAEAGPLDELQRARADLLRGQIAFSSGRGGAAPALLLAAAKRLEPLDATLARDTYLEAFSATMFVGQLAGDVGVREVARAARGVPPSPQPRNGDRLLDGRAVLFTDGYPAAVPISRRALQAFCCEDVSATDGLRWLWLATLTAADLWDDQSWHVLATRHVQIARQAGALSDLPLALASRVFVHLFAGELAAAASLVEEMKAVREATGSNFAPYGALALAALSGQGDKVEELIGARMSEVVPRGDGLWVTVSRWASAVLGNGLGRYEQALAAARQVCEDPPQQFGFWEWSLAELVEAGVRCGQTGRASEALQQLAETARASGTDWALGMEARSRAQLSEGDTAENLYAEAIERLGRTRVRLDLARARLLYGEWLRREGRRVDAREQLRAAHQMLTAMGVEGFAERARRELAVTGETVPKQHYAEPREELTAQETQIARLAGDGRTNPEIGAELFISPRTVEWHLHKVYPKLGISSRRQLHEALSST
jgi:DNA-binding CsgD family transcriptional regulator